MHTQAYSAAFSINLSFNHMSHHSECEARSYENLNDAWKRALDKTGYNASARHEEMAEWVWERFDGREPHPWQLDVGEAIVLVLDALMISPTGSGKSLPFIIPLAGQPDKKIVITSPLIALQMDMVNHTYVTFILCWEVHKDGHIFCSCKCGYQKCYLIKGDSTDEILSYIYFCIFRKFPRTSIKLFWHPQRCVS